MILHATHISSTLIAPLTSARSYLEQWLPTVGVQIHTISRLRMESLPGYSICSHTPGLSETGLVGVGDSKGLEQPI